MKVGVRSRKLAGAVECLVRGIQDGGRVRGGFDTEGDFLFQQGKRDTDRCTPCPIGNITPRACNGGWEVRLFTGADSRCGEFRGPPGTVRGEVEFEVCAACGIGEEELRDVMLPQPFRE